MPAHSLLVQDQVTCSGEAGTGAASSAPTIRQSFLVAVLVGRYARLDGRAQRLAQVRDQVADVLNPD